MASLLRQIVAGPRARHPEAGLDLCYVTDSIIATSGPSGTYPQLAYRNPLKQLVKFLDEKHGDQWAIWEFRAEGTGYPDSEVYNRIYHYPWPDHHPPPFALIPLIVASMRNWLKGDELQRETNVQEDNTRSVADGEQLTWKLEAVNLEQQQQQNGDLGALEPAQPEPPPPPPISKTAPEDGEPLADGSIEPPSEASTNASSPNISGTSTPTSTRRKKIVRWRESTLLPPKEDRDNLAKDSSTTPDSKDTKDAPSKLKKSGSKDKDKDKEKEKEKEKSKTKDKPKKSERVVVVHCKAGKGRSGTASCSYLISQEGWTVQSALQRFTERRMRPGFGAGVSIPSQLRWVGYVDRWSRNGKKYTERPTEITEVHVWGLRDRVKVSIGGFKDDGRKIEVLHSFSKEEREIVRGNGLQKAPGFAGVVSDVVQQEKARRDKSKSDSSGPSVSDKDAIDQAVEGETSRSKTTPANLAEEGGAGDVVYRPKEKIVVDTNDVNIDFERRNKGVSNLSMITSVAHVWFNTFFEGDGPERDGVPRDTGVFEIEWDRMDGIKGSSRKGTRAFDRLAVVWRAVADAPARDIKGPSEGEGVKDAAPADWTGVQQKDDERDIGANADSASTSEKEDSRPGTPGTPGRVA